jgi:hypothetical protein
MRGLLFSVLFLCGCATTGDFSQGMGQLIGQPIDVAFKRLGYPDRQEVIAGRTIYYYGTDHPTGPSCSFKLVTDAGIVRSWDGIGNAAGCGMYLRGLRQ